MFPLLFCWFLLKQRRKIIECSIGCECCWLWSDFCFQWGPNAWNFTCAGRGRQRVSLSIVCGGEKQHLILSIVTFPKRQSMLSRCLSVYLFECLCKWGRGSSFLCLSDGTQCHWPHFINSFLPIFEFYGGDVQTSCSVLPSLEWITSVVLGIISGSTSHAN